MSTSDLGRRVAWLITARLLVSTVLLGWASLLQWRLPHAEVRPFFLLIALTYGLSIGFALTVRLVSGHRWLVDIQLAGDVLVISLFIAFTGGINSSFASLYFLPIIAGAGLQMRRGALAVAVLTGLLYAGMTVWQYQDLASVPPWLRAEIALPAARVAVYTIVINLFAYGAVGYLAGSLAEGIRTAGVKLERASTEIRNLQALNDHVVNSLSSGLVTSDYDGRVLTFNRAAEQITGWPADETIGRSTGDVLQLPDGFLASLEPDLDRSHKRRADYTYKTRHGTSIDMGLSATYLVTPGGRAGYLFNFQDVTDVKKLERDARMQQRLAAVGEMAAGIAHEIRNPLASISGSIQILGQELRLSEEQGQLMQIVTRESERLNGIIRSFLAYARPQKFAIKPLELGRVVRDAAVLLRNSPEVAGHHAIETELPPGDVWYEADEGQIRQIIWNLATNGLRAMPSGGRLRLAVRMERAGDSIAGSAPEVVLAVEDEGVGISPEDLDDVFQPFHGTFAKGSGLGLAIVHRIVSDYGGEIQVRSREGAGTAVTVRLPGRAVAAV
ncbi:MAG: two-component system sensor histidine kinase NtrB [Bacteroidales bacterium]